MDFAKSPVIPIEKGLPILGVLPKLIQGDPFEYLKDVMLRHGDFVQFNLGPQTVYLVSHPDYLKRILWENYLNYRKPEMMYAAARKNVGNGLITSSGEFWLRQRRMIQPHLHRKALSHLFSDMIDAISDVLNRWDVLVKNGTQVDFAEKMAEISSNVTMRTMFGRGIISVEEISVISGCVTRMVQRNTNTLYRRLLPAWVPLPGQKEYESDRKVVKDAVNNIIAICRQQKSTSASLIQMLLSAVDDETQQQMTDQQLFDEAMTIVIAGYETTATALTWLSVVISEHPEILIGLLQEIDEVLDGRIPTFEDVPHLVYTRQVFMEIMRMYTVVPFLPRALNQADQLGPYHLPANAMILVFYHGVHHNPHVWDNPEVFDPGRFTPENIAKQNAFAYVPFSAGPRKCAGNDFALMEGTLAIAMMLQKYNINVLPRQTFAAKMGGTMRPQHGVQVTFSNRTSP